MVDDGWESLKKPKPWSTTTESGKIIGTHLHLGASCDLLYFMFLVSEYLYSILLFQTSNLHDPHAHAC